MNQITWTKEPETWQIGNRQHYKHRVYNIGPLWLNTLNYCISICLKPAFPVSILQYSVKTVPHYSYSQSHPPISRVSESFQNVFFFFATHTHWWPQKREKVIFTSKMFQLVPFFFLSFICNTFLHCCIKLVACERSLWSVSDWLWYLPCIFFVIGFCFESHHYSRLQRKLGRDSSFWGSRKIAF